MMELMNLTEECEGIGLTGLRISAASTAVTPKTSTHSTSLPMSKKSATVTAHAPEGVFKKGGNESSYLLAPVQGTIRRNRMLVSSTSKNILCNFTEDLTSTFRKEGKN